MPVARALFATIVALAPALPLSAAPLPPPVAAMIEASAGDADVFKGVVATARATNPDSGAEIDAQVAAIRTRQAEAHQAYLERQSALQGWSGAVETGLTNETGNTVSTALVFGLELSKEALRWQHNFSLNAKVKTEDDVLTKKRILIGYQGNYALSPRLYVALVGSWTQDTFAGVNSRFLESAGLGYKVFDSPGLKLRLEAGPALRQTDYVNSGRASGTALRLAGDMKWKVTKWLTFSEVAAYIYQGSGSTLSNLTSLTTRLTDSFSTRLSFDVQDDDNPPPGRLSTDTTTLFTIVYEF